MAPNSVQTNPVHFVALCSKFFFLGYQKHIFQVKHVFAELHTLYFDNFVNTILEATTFLERDKVCVCVCVSVRAYVCVCLWEREKQSCNYVLKKSRSVSSAYLIPRCCCCCCSCCGCCGCCCCCLRRSVIWLCYDSIEGLNCNVPLILVVVHKWRHTFFINAVKLTGLSDQFLTND